MVEIICSGFGGQGILTAGLILADAGMEEGKHVTWYPSYGAEMRGGTANCNVILSEEEIASPYCSDLDILLTMNDVAVGKFEHRLRPGGLLLVNSSLADANRIYRDDVRVIEVPANDISAELDNPRGINIVMLGALAYASEDFDAAYMREAVDKYFEKRGRVEPKNRLCFDRGADCAKEQIG